MLFAAHGSQFAYSVSHTTRLPRPGEVNGREYYFVDKSTFESLIQSNEFLEWAIYSKNYYGTSLSSLQTCIQARKIPLLDIDLAGVKSIKKLIDRVPSRFVFLKTADLTTLESRLRQRGTETEESLQRRLIIAKEEIAYAESVPDTHDRIIINDDVNEAYQQLENFIFNEYRSDR
jgi:guanylate kinase